MSRKDAQPDPEAGAGYGTIEPEVKTEPRPSRRRLVLAAAVAAIVFAAGLTQTANIMANTIETPYVLSQFPPAPSWGACGGLSNLCHQDRACTGCAEPGYTCIRGNEFYWQCRDDTPSDQLEDGRDAPAGSPMTNLAISQGGGGGNGGFNVNVGTNSKSSSLPADGPTLLGAASDTFDCNNSCFCDWSTGQEPRYSYFCNQARRLASLIAQGFNRGRVVGKTIHDSEVRGNNGLVETKEHPEEVNINGAEEFYRG